MEVAMVSCCLIVKNEIDVFERCINSIKDILKGVVDEIIVVDTGSTDGTQQLAFELGCKVFDFEWCHDFAKARNFAVSKAKNDWVFSIDADEFIVSVDIDSIKNIILNLSETTVGEIPVVNYGDEKGQRYTISYLGRIFNKKEVCFTRSIHEYLCSEKNIDLEYVDLPIEVHHTGYVEEVIKDKNKTERNIDLIKKELLKTKDNYLMMHLGKSYIDLEKYEEAKDVLKSILDNEDSVKYEYYTETAREYVRCLILACDFEKALECEEYWNRCSVNEGYVYMMGQAYMKNGYFEKAVDCFIDVASREHCKMNRLDAIYSLGQLFELLGMKEESGKYYQMCGGYADAEICYARVCS